MSGVNVVAIMPTLGAVCPRSCIGPRVDSHLPNRLRAEHLKAHIASRAHAYNKTTRLKDRCLPASSISALNLTKLLNMAKQPSHEGQRNPHPPGRELKYLYSKCRHSRLPSCPVRMGRELRHKGLGPSLEMHRARPPRASPQALHPELCL